MGGRKSTSEWGRRRYPKVFWFTKWRKRSNQILLRNFFAKHIFNRDAYQQILQNYTVNLPDCSIIFLLCIYSLNICNQYCSIVSPSSISNFISLIYFGIYWLLFLPYTSQCSYWWESLYDFSLAYIVLFFPFSLLFGLFNHTLTIVLDHWCKWFFSQERGTVLYFQRSWTLGNGLCTGNNLILTYRVLVDYVSLYFLFPPFVHRSAHSPLKLMSGYPDHPEIATMHDNFV